MTLFGGGILVIMIATLVYLGDNDFLGVSNQINQPAFAQQQVKTINVGRIPTGIVIDEEENKAYVANYKSHSISVIDGSTYAVDSFSVPSFPRNMALDVSSDILYVSHHMNSSVSVIDLKTRQVTDTIPVGAGSEKMALDAASSELYVVNRGSDTIQIIDTATNSVLKTVNVGKSPQDIAINPTTGKVYVAVSTWKNSYVAIIDGNTDSVITKIPIKGAGAVSVDPNNNLVYVGAYSFSGVDQTNPIPTSATNIGSGSPTISLTTLYPNSWVLDSPSIWGGVTLGSPTCTPQWNVNVPDAVTGASSSTVQTSPGLVTCSWTASSGDAWDAVAVEVKASG
jgi:YVTN family beta-propeller protein